MAPLPESSIRTLLTSLLSRSPSSSPTPSTTLPLSPLSSLSDLTPKTALLLARAQDLILTKRADTDSPPVGVTPPENIPNKAVFALFGLIGAGFVISGIWFFFWAKNGGFYFQENDWDDYKSTILRRKGPNGTTLSGATESTDLGGGSVVHGGSRWGKVRRNKNKKGKKEERYKDFEFDEETEYTGGGPESTVGGSELSELKEKEKENKRAGKDKKKSSHPHYAQPSEMSEVSTVIGDEEMDVGVHAPHEELRAYRSEKPARVGGLNRQADGSAFDGSANDGSSAASDLLSHREKTPQHTPTRVRKQRKDNYTGGSGDGTGGIRKVVSTSEGGSSSFWSRGSETEEKKKSKTLLDTCQEVHIKAEAQRLQEKGRAAQRRDFSFRVGDDTSTVSGTTPTSASDDRERRREERERRRASRSPVKKLAVPGSYADERDESVVGSLMGGSAVGSEESSDIGTKSYRHVIPGLSSNGGSDYADEKRKKRNTGGAGGGYRRGRGDELD